MEIPPVKPLNISFPSTEEREQIGRRRKLTKEEVEAHLDRVKRRKRETLARHSLGDRHSSSINDHDHDKVSIRIGGSIHGSQWTELAPTLRQEELPHSGKDDEMLFSSDHSSQFSSVVLDDGINGKKISRKRNPPSSQSLGLNYVHTIPRDRGYVGRSAIRPVYASNATTNVRMQDQLTLKSFVEGENTRLQRDTSDLEIGKSLVGNYLNTTSYNPTNMRLVFGSQQLHTNSSRSDTVHQSEEPSRSERSMCAQASKPSEECELDPDEEEWRGFLDISGSSEVAIEERSLNCQSQLGDTGHKDERDHERTLVGVRRSSSPLEVSAYENADDQAELSIALKTNARDITTQYDTVQQDAILEQDTAAQTPDDNNNFQEMTKPPGKVDTPDENKAWYKFVFGHEMDEDAKSDPDMPLDSTYQRSAKILQPVYLNSADSLAVQPSDILSTPPTTDLPQALHSSLLTTAASSTSPPHSTLHPSQTSTACSLPTPRRILFRKPIPFTGKYPRPTALCIGHASISSPLAPQTRRRGRKAGLTESTAAEDGSMASVLEDEDEDDIED